MAWGISRYAKFEWTRDVALIHIMKSERILNMVSQVNSPSPKVNDDGKMQRTYVAIEY